MQLSATENFYVCLDTQITSSNESATPHEYTELFMFNLPSNLGWLQVLFTSGPIVKFSINILKGLVRVPDVEITLKLIAII